MRPLITAFERLGRHPRTLLVDAGFGRVDLDDPDGQMPCEAFVALLEGARRRGPDRNLALSAAEATPIGAYPLVDYLVLSSATVGEGLGRLSRYYRLIGAPTPLELRDDEDPIRVVMRAPVPFVVEYSVLLPLLHLRRETEGRALARWVSFAHRPDDAAGIERTLGCPVRAGDSWDGFALSNETWRLPMRRRDPVLLTLLERQAETATGGPSWGDCVRDRVRRALDAALAGGDAGIGAVARALALSTRTLQRRLADEGVSFQELLDQVRRDAAERHLRRSVLSIAEISFALGYSEPAAFHRAFRRWHRTTPQVFRAGAGGESRV